ncbi:MAG: hypothetical protein JOY93_10070 [Acidobacteriales bacterium]|nr:hypothetical protein [Terriglobales bacterium]
MSNGGLCIRTREPLSALSILRCDVAMTEVPVRIPTLMLVCWTQEQELQTESYLSGLRFLF